MRAVLREKLEIQNSKFERYLVKTISNLKRVFDTNKIEINFKNVSRDKFQAMITVSIGRKKIFASGFGSSRMSSLCEARKNIKNKFNHVKRTRGIVDGVKKNQKSSQEFDKWPAFEAQSSDKNWGFDELGKAG